MDYFLILSVYLENIRSLPRKLSIFQIYFFSEHLEGEIPHEQAGPQARGI